MNQFEELKKMKVLKEEIIHAIKDNKEEKILQFIESEDLNKLLFVGSLSDGYSEDDIAVIKFALEHGANPNYEYRDELALKTAIFFRRNYKNTRNIDAMRLLLKHGADVNKTNLLFECCYRGAALSEEIKLLLEYGATIEPYCGNEILSLAIKNCNLELVKLIFEYRPNVDVNKQDENGLTALHYACERNNIDAVELLLKHNAKANIRDFTGSTALHYAYKPEVIKKLLECVTDVDIQNNKGNTALHNICEKSYFSSIELLLEHGANPNIQNEQGRVPLHYMCMDKKIKDEVLQEKSTVFIEVLLKHNANTNIKDRLGNTALHYACIDNHLDNVELLLKYGAEVTLENFEDVYKKSGDIIYNPCRLESAVFNNQRYLNYVKDKTRNIKIRTALLKSVINTNKIYSPLQILSENKSINSLQKLIQKNAEDDQKKIMCMEYQEPKDAIMEYEKLTKKLDNVINRNNKDAVIRLLEVRHSRNKGINHNLI